MKSVKANMRDVNIILKFQYRAKKQLFSFRLNSSPQLVLPVLSLGSCQKEVVINGWKFLVSPGLSLAPVGSRK